MDDIRTPKKEPTVRHEPKLAVRPEPNNKDDQHVVKSVVALPKPKRWRQNPLHLVKKYWQDASKKKKIITLSVAAGMLVGGGLGAFFIFSSEPEPEPTPVIVEPEVIEPPEPTTVASPLTGVQVEPELAELPVTGVIIENSPDARPQSGLIDAGVVFEAMVEGSITRFLALYQEGKPKHIGPLRSLRRNHIDWLLGFDAAIAHVGGSPLALSRATSQNVKSLNQFNHPEAYWRVNTRFAPHNMYTSRDGLLKIHNKLGYNSSDFNGFVRKTPEPAETPDATEASVNISGPMYNVRYAYDSENNNYQRFMGGSPHLDEQTGDQITPDAVVIMVASYRRDGIYSVYEAVGNGTAFIFQDGTVIKGTWEKRNRRENIRFGDENGSPIGLNPGQTWITLATNENQVSVKP